METNQNENNGFSKLKELAVYRAGARELSESGYNRTIGLMLMYGFGVNALITYVTRTPILNYVTAHAVGWQFWVIFLIAYMLLCVGGSAIMHKTESTGMCFLAYNMIVVPIGALISIATCRYDPELITRAMLLTCIVSAGMLLVGTLKPQLFLSMGPALITALSVALLVQIVSSLIFRYSSSMIDWIVIIIMALYIGFDWARANQLQRTTRNAIIVTTSLYLDIVNIFLRLLRILARSRRS